MFKSIVWATDGSDSADRALSYVKQLAREGGAAITVVHVVERIEGLGAGGLPRRADEGEVQARLRKLAAEFSEEGLSVSLEIRGEVGARPAHEIVDVAREAGADLIVAGTRGLTAIGGLLLGSVTQRLLHLAPCPVLVVPPHSERTAFAP
jgi:nucleotide-binding universal stress UspA family protein